MHFNCVQCKQKGFAPILIVILIALAVGGYLFIQKQTKIAPSPTTQFTSTPTSTPIPPPESTNSAETANWKTYTNDKYGISINYPTDLNYKSEGPNISQQQMDKGQQISGTIAPSFDKIDFTGGNQDFNIGIFHTNTPSQIADTSSGFDGSCGNQFVDKTLVNQIGQIGNIKYHKLEQSSNAKISLQYCFLSNTQNLIVLSAFNLDNSKSNSADQLLQKILSTFKFLDQNQAETANWKTYQSEKYKFSIKYPDIYKTDTSEAPDNQTHETVSNLRLLGPVYAVEIYAQNDSSGLSLSDWITKYAKLYIKNAKNITINNQPGYRFVRNNMGAAYSLVYIKKDNIIYSMQIVPEDNPIFDQILSTFRFD